MQHYTAWKLSKYGVISGPYFPVFRHITEIYSVNLRIQSEYRKIRTRNNSVFGHFSRSVMSLSVLFSFKVRDSGTYDFLWKFINLLLTVLLFLNFLSLPLNFAKLFRTSFLQNTCAKLFETSFLQNICFWKSTGFYIKRSQ